MEICVQCNKKPIVNKKYKICDDCNYFRLHGKTKFEVAVEKESRKVKKSYYIKRTTVKNLENKKELSKVKVEFEEHKVLNNEYYCEGCGNAPGGLDKSHILSIKQREDLQLDKKNLNLFCRDCHLDWESNDIERMVNLNCFESNLKYIKENDIIRYNKLITKIEEYLEKNESEKMSKILFNFSEN